MSGVGVDVTAPVLHPLETSDRPGFITRLQAAFDAGAASFGNESDEPVISEAEIRQSMDQPGAATWVVRQDGRRVGGAVVAIGEDGRRASLDLLFIDTAGQGKGLGKRVWACIEARYPAVEVWRTMTPYEDTRNIHLYVNTCGFHIVEFFHPGHPDPSEPPRAGSAGEASGADLMFAFEKRRSPADDDARSDVRVDGPQDENPVELRPDDRGGVLGTEGVTMRRRLRDGFDATSLALADIFQTWDVLGVYEDEDDRPEDDEEYDDLVSPMRVWLSSGMTPEELSRSLTEKLRRHYGLSPESPLAALDFTSRVHSWWHSSPRPGPVRGSAREG